MMKTDLEGKVALITGTGSDRGIGRALALEFAKVGALLCCVDRNLSGCRKVADEILKFGGKATAIKADVSKAREVRRTVDRCERELGAVDVLVNNAGFAHFSSLLELDEEIWDRTMEVNVKGYFLFAQCVARKMIQYKRSGCMINISSISAVQVGRNKVHYCASKAAVKMLTEGLALELAAHGIRVNAIAPGDIETNILKDPSLQRSVKKPDYIQSIPLGRRGKPEDLVGAALLLASGQASYITGASLVVDGGLLQGTISRL